VLEHHLGKGHTPARQEPRGDAVCHDGGRSFLRRHSASDRRTFFFFLLAFLRLRRRRFCKYNEFRMSTDMFSKKGGNVRIGKFEFTDVGRLRKEFKKALDDVCA